MAAAANVSVKPEVGNMAKIQKLPEFQDDEDELDSDLQKFELFAITNKLDPDQWTPALCTLLTGRALEVY